MESSEARSTKCAFWCGILEGDTPSVAPERVVRTVRGLYTALREPAKHDSAVAAVSRDAPRPRERLL